MTSLIQYFYQCWKQLPIRLRGRIIIAIPVSCLFTSLFALAWLKASLIEDESWVQHTQIVRLETKKLLNSLINAEGAIRGYGLTLREDFLTPYNQALIVIPQSLERLEQLVQDNPQQTQQIQQIKNQVNQTLVTLEQKVILQQQAQGEQEELWHSPSDLYDWLKVGKATMESTRLAIDEFGDIEENLLKTRQEHQEFYRKLTWIVLYLAVAIGTLSSYLALHLFYNLERELANREMNLQSTNQRLELVCDQLQRFTANASHELRTPLAAVLSNAQVGLMDLNDLENPPLCLRKRLEKIVQITKEMSSLVSELLFLARHEGLLNLDSLKAVNVNELLKGLITDWTLEMETNQLQLNCNLCDQAIWVKADFVLLRQAIANLMSNACRYTLPGGTITLSLTTEIKQAIIEVRDTGIGIPDHSIPHIFERFYRVNHKRSNQSGGFGLGLAITQQIVQVHKGKIVVFSCLDQGSIFKIYLPLLK